MLNQLISLLNGMHFECQNISFKHLLATSSLKELHNISMPSTNAVRILQAFPDLFVVHRSSEPKKGIFFIVLSEDGTIPKSKSDIYSKYFPNRLMIIYKDKTDSFNAYWFNNNDSRLPLISFLKKYCI